VGDDLDDLDREYMRAEAALFSPEAAAAAASNAEPRRKKRHAR
jgi:hypothetical protein